MAVGLEFLREKVEDYLYSTLFSLARTYCVKIMGKDQTAEVPLDLLNHFHQQGVVGQVQPRSRK